MANDYFKFKQFTVFQDKCAMKVGTDGVLLGAWADAQNAKSILDVGTGTGLISLMIAQRSPYAHITAIDIDGDATAQSAENFANSAWQSRLTAKNISLQHFAQTNENGRFDLIISNPPFFVNSLQNPDNKRSAARHANTLTHGELLFYAEKLLSTEGKICIVLPVEQGENCIKFAESIKIYCTKKVSVQPNYKKPVKRLLLEFSHQNLPLLESKICIENGNRGVYNEEFAEMVREFYLERK